MLTKILLLILALSSPSWERMSNASASQSKYGPEATPLSVSHAFFRAHDAPGFWALMPYYIPQQTESSCSVATVAMVVNASRAGIRLKAEERQATESDLLEKVKQGAWKKSAWSLHKGATLDELKPLLEASLKAYGVNPLSVEAVHVDDQSDESKKKLHVALMQVGKSAQVFLVVNFIQGVYTGDADVGHFAPVGAYDPETKRVLILDPDREWYEPYWVSENTFLKGMAIRDRTSNRSRGYILVKLPERQ